MNAVIKHTKPTELQKVERAIAGMDKVRAGLDQLSEKYSGVIFEVATKEGMAAAKEARATVREPRYEVERIRKEAKAPILALGKHLDSTAAAITREIEKIEHPICKQIDEEEARIEAEKQARIAAEAARVKRHRDQIEAIRMLPVKLVGKSSTDVRSSIDFLGAVKVTPEEFEEFFETALEAHKTASEALALLYADVVEQEALREAARLQRIENDRLQAEAAERARVERARQAEEDQKARAAIRAEQEALARDREQLRAMQREQQAAQDRLQRAEEIVHTEKAKTAPPAPPAPTKSVAPGSDAILDCVAEHFRVPRAQALQWLQAIDWEGKRC